VASKKKFPPDGGTGVRPGAVCRHFSPAPQLAPCTQLPNPWADRCRFSFAGKVSTAAKIFVRESNSWGSEFSWGVANAKFGCHSGGQDPGTAAHVLRFREKRRSTREGLLPTVLFTVHRYLDPWKFCTGSKSIFVKRGAGVLKFVVYRSRDDDRSVLLLDRSFRNVLECS
jgi:hypothetical protein